MKNFRKSDYLEAVKYVMDKNNDTFTNLQVKNSLRYKGFWATQKNVSQATQLSLDTGDVVEVSDNGTFKTYEYVAPFPASVTRTSTPKTPQGNIPIGNGKPFAFVASNTVPLQPNTPQLTETVVKANLEKLREDVKATTNYKKAYTRKQTQNAQMGGNGLRYEFYDVECTKADAEALVTKLDATYNPQYSGVRVNDNGERTIYFVWNY